MAQPVIQHSFQSGEWAPALNARVDLQKYRSAAALLRNFFVDYRGGASTCPGSKYIGTAGSTNTVRLIPFQASTTLGYVLEFGDRYIRFITNGAYVLSGGVPYQIVSPYLASELFQIKYAQNVNALILCHPNHAPQVLTLISATNWTIAAIVFGPTLTSPTIASGTISGGTSTTNYLYQATAVDINGQESYPSGAFGLNGADISGTTKGSIHLSLSATITGAYFYKFYKAPQNYGGGVPSGPAFGYIGYSYTADFIDDNIAPDFSQTPPISGSTFSSGGSVIATTITFDGAGSFAAVPDVSFAAPPPGGARASAYAIMEASGVTLNNPGLSRGYAVGDLSTANGMTFQVTSVVFPIGQVNTAVLVNPGTFAGAGSALQSYVTPTNITGTGGGLAFNVAYHLKQIVITYGGALYTVAPAISFSTGTATATSTINPINTSTQASTFQNATVPAFFQERLVLAAPPNAPQSFYMSRTGLPYNFDLSNPVQADDSISGAIVDSQLNAITAMVQMPQGMIMFGSSGAWLVNGGQTGAAITPSNATAQHQAYEGSSDIKPIVVNYDVLYVQSKGSIVRDLTWNFYLGNHVGTDITLLSSHLFYGYTLKEWCYAEEPFKLVWAVRSDGTLLILTYVKEQEILGWSHRDTNGSYKSVCTVSEQVTLSNGQTVIVDAVYVLVQRTINGSVVQYVERFAERAFPSGTSDAWCVDAGIQYIGLPTTSFTGAQHLAGMTCVGLADGVAITPFTMPVSGNFTLPSPASKVTIGLQFTPQLQTLRLDVGERTIQGKRKKIPAVTLRVENTLGLSIGGSFDTLVAMKDLIVGNVGSMSNQVVTGLVTDDARAYMDPSWTVQGQYCIQQSQPFPATILGVIPELDVGDTP